MKSRYVLICFCIGVTLCGLPAAAVAENGVTQKEITVGMSTVLVGPALFLGTSFRLGAMTYLNAVNEGGGIHGRKIKLIVYDDGYEPAKAVVNTKKLIKEDKVFCLLGNVGTPTTVAIKPILESERVPLFAPFTGAESIRNPVSRYLLHYRASYNQELEEFIKGAVDTLALKKIAVFYQDDAYGKAVLGAAKLALSKREMYTVAEGTYVRNFLDVSRALNDIMAAKPEVVIMGGTYSACAKFIIAWKRQSIMKKSTDPDPIFMNVSFVGPDKLQELLGRYGEKSVVTQVVPPFSGAKSDPPAVNEYLTLLRKYYPRERPSFVGMEGFLATKVFVETLRRTGKDLTRERFVQTAEAIQGLDIQAGNNISFSPTNHQGSQVVYPTVIQNGQFQIIRDWNAVR